MKGQPQKKKPGFWPGFLRESEKFLPVILDDQVIDDAVGFVDVVDGAIAQSTDGRIIFFAGNIVVRLVEQFEGAMKAATAVHVGVDRRMIVQVLAVINRGVLDFADGFIDLFDGVLFFAVHVFGCGELAEVSASVAQVGEGMQVRRMASGFVAERQSGADGDKKYEYGAMSYSFHSLLMGCFWLWLGGLSAEMCFVGSNPSEQFLTRPILGRRQGLAKVTLVQASD
jgi:hypothetical protein